MIVTEIAQNTGILAYFSRQGHYTHTTFIKTLKINQGHVTKIAWLKFPCVLRNVLIIISDTTGKNDWATGSNNRCCLLFTCSYFLFTTKTHKHFPFSSCSESLLKSTFQHLLLLVGFDTLTYGKDYDRSPILVGHQPAFTR